MFKNDTDKLDQHFLIDEDVINKFINSAEINKDDKVLEVGAGKGVLTKRISELTNNLTVVEKDIRLVPFLKDYNVIYRDVMYYDIKDVNKIVTSLPYSITEGFMYKLIDVNFDKCVMMVGKKFVDSVYENNTKLAIMVNSFFNVERIMDVDKKCFNPEPKVMSSLISVTKKDENTLNEKELIVKNLYLYRFMKVKNALKEILIKLNNITQRQAREIVDKYNIDEVILNKEFDELSSNEVITLRNKILD